MADIPSPDEIKRFFDAHPTFRGKEIPQDALSSTASWNTWRAQNAPQLSEGDMRYFQKQAESTTTETTDSDGEETHDNHKEHAEDTTRERPSQKGIVDDKRYQNIINNTVEDWNTKYPNDQITGDVFIDDGYGTKVINPEIYKKIPDIHERAKETLSLGHGQGVVDYYDRAEATRIYKDPRSDPAYQALRKTKNPDGMGVARPVGREDYDKFVREHPEKAARYRRIDPQIDAAVNRYGNELRALGRSQGRMARIYRWAKNRPEQNKIYTNPSEDPAVIGINDAIKTRISQGVSRAQATEEALDDFVKHNKKKATAYAKSREDIRRAVDKRTLPERLRTSVSNYKDDRRDKREKGSKERFDRWINRIVSVQNRWENFKSFIYRDPKKDKRLAFLSVLDPNNPQYKKRMDTFIKNNPKAARRYREKDQRIDNALRASEKAREDSKSRRKQARTLSQKRSFRYKASRRLRQDNTIVAEGLMFEAPPLQKLKTDEQKKSITPRPELSTAQQLEFEKFQRGRLEVRGKFRDWRQDQAPIQNTPQTFSRFRRFIPQPPFRGSQRETGRAAPKTTPRASSRALSTARSLPGVPGKVANVIINQTNQFLMRYIYVGIVAFLLALFLTIIIMSIFAFIFFVVKGTDEQPPPSTPTTTPAPTQLTISVEGPPEADINDNIVYTIRVGGITTDVVVTDTITGKATYVTANPEPESGDIERDSDSNVKTIKWRFSPDTGSEQIISLTVKPNDPDQKIFNVADVIPSSDTSPAPGGNQDVPKPGTPPDLSTDDFTKLMAGQGRNTGILGDEDAFVEAIYASVDGQRNLSNRAVYEPFVRQIYQQSVRNDLNPLIPLVMWGVESSYTIDGTEYSCPRDIENESQQGFEAQLSCAINTMNRFMTEFENKYDGENPVPYQKPECVFTDPFVYAYEAYTPVCAYSDSNDNARSNFVILFKEFLGGD